MDVARNVYVADPNVKTIMAKPNDEQIFFGWHDGDNRFLVSTENPYKITITEDTVLTLRFRHSRLNIYSGVNNVARHIKSIYVGVDNIARRVRAVYVGVSNKARKTGVWPRLPMGYTEVEYIESNGNQYIDTGVKPTESTTINIKADTSGIAVGTYMFGSIYSPSSYGTNAPTGTMNYFTLLINESEKAVRFGYGNSTWNVTVPTVYAEGTISLSSSGDYYTHNYMGTRNTVERTAIKKNLENNPSIALFARKGNWNGFNYFDNKSIYKLYSCNISTGSTVSREFIPCINEEGNVGLYDLKNSLFYGNKGTGDFIAGPSV